MYYLLRKANEGRLERLIAPLLSGIGPLLDGMLYPFDLKKKKIPRGLCLLNLQKQ